MGESSIPRLSEEASSWAAADLRRCLSRLSSHKCVAFTLWCSEHLYSNYVTYLERRQLQDTGRLRNIIDRIWQELLGLPLTDSQVTRFIQECEEIDLSDESDEYWGAAVDAVGTVWLALESLRRDAIDNAAKAAENTINTVHQRLCREVLGTSYILSPEEWPGIHEAIESDPRMRAERRRIWEQVLFLTEHELTIEVIGQLRTGT